jgi:20S proteasome subunit alpha 4
MTENNAIKLAVETLLEIVESPKNIEVCVSTKARPNHILDDETVEKFVREI